MEEKEIKKLMDEKFKNILIANPSLKSMIDHLNISEEKFHEIMKYTREVLDKENINKSELIIELASLKNFSLKEKLLASNFIFEYIGYHKSPLRLLINEDE